MPYDAAVKCISSAIEILVLSWTPYARLISAAGPRDYDVILNRTLRELKFHIESFLAILFFMATAEVRAPLISWTLACLLYTLLIHIFLDAISGEVLHHWLTKLPLTLHLLACLVKLPAHAVVATLFALALTTWPSVYTVIVCCFVASGLVGMLMMRLGGWKGVARGVIGMGRWAVKRARCGRGSSKAAEGVGSSGRRNEGEMAMGTCMNAGDTSPTVGVETEKDPSCVSPGVMHANELV